MEKLKETLYIALVQKVRGSGVVARLFLFPELPGIDVDPAWWYLNRIDQYNVLEKVIKFDELFDTSLFDEDQKKNVLELSSILIVRCAWCKKFKMETTEGENWFDLKEGEWNIEHLRTSITHGVCPECAKSAYGGLIQRQQSSEGS